jgi:hypothetical protein
MVAVLAAPLALAWRSHALSRTAGLILLAAYPAFLVAVLVIR